MARLVDQSNNIRWSLNNAVYVPASQYYTVFRIFRYIVHICILLWTKPVSQKLSTFSSFSNISGYSHSHAVWALCTNLTRNYLCAPDIRSRRMNKFQSGRQLRTSLISRSNPPISNFPTGTHLVALHVTLAWLDCYLVEAILPATFISSTSITFAMITNSSNPFLINLQRFLLSLPAFLPACLPWVDTFIS